jgi:hypothetical protein
MLLIVALFVLVMYVSRFLVTDFLDKSGVHPRSISSFRSSLDVARELEEREIGISFGRSAAREKFLLLDNVLEAVEFREGVKRMEVESHSLSELENRISQYSEHFDRLGREIEGSIALQKDKDEILAVIEVRPEGAGGREPLLARCVHISCMVLLGLLAIVLVLAG